MRADDDQVYGGCNLHGLYDPNHSDQSDDTIVVDFLSAAHLLQARGAARGAAHGQLGQVPMQG